MVSVLWQTSDKNMTFLYKIAISSDLKVAINKNLAKLIEEKESTDTKNNK